MVKGRNTTPFTVRLPDSLAEIVSVRAQKRNMSPVEYIRWCVERRVDRKRWKDETSKG